MLSWHSVSTVEISWLSKFFIITIIVAVICLLWLPFCSCLPAGLPQPFTNITCMKSWDWLWEDLSCHGLRREAQELSDGDQLIFILGFSTCSIGEGCCETSGYIHTLGKLRQVLSGEIRLTPLAGLKKPPWWCLVLVLNYWKGHWGTRRLLIFV